MSKADFDPNVHQCNVAIWNYSGEGVTFQSPQDNVISIFFGLISDLIIPHWRDQIEHSRLIKVASLHTGF